MPYKPGDPIEVIDIDPDIDYCIHYLPLSEGTLSEETLAVLREYAESRRSTGNSGPDGTEPSDRGIEAESEDGRS